jgi:hypothetical protein
MIKQLNIKQPLCFKLLEFLNLPVIRCYGVDKVSSKRTKNRLQQYHYQQQQHLFIFSYVRVAPQNRPKWIVTEIHFCDPPLDTKHELWSNPASYTGGPGLKFRPRDRLTSLCFVEIFFSVPPYKSLDSVNLKSGQDHFLPCPFLIKH